VFATRPAGCRDVIPAVEQGDCVADHGEHPKRYAALAWLPYADVLGAL
jgi:hypothetical protein